MGTDDDLEAQFTAIHDALQRDGVYVDPSLARQFTDADLAAIAEHLAEAPAPAFVVAYPLRTNDQFAGSGTDLLTRLHDRFPEPGTYFVTTSAFSEYDSVRIEAREWGVSGPAGSGDYQLLGIVSDEAPATFGEAFARATDLLDVGYEELTEIAEQASDDAAAAREAENGGSGSTSPGSDDTGSDAGGGFDPTGLVVAVLVCAVVAALGRTLVKQLGRGRGTSGSGSGDRAGYVLPSSALEHIRAAHDRGLEQQARDELLALGEAVDDAEIAPRDDRVSWQQALDHHDAARRVLDRVPPGASHPDVLDVVGALVLTRRGRDALAAARRGRSWRPSPDCYLDPLHGTAAGNRVVALDGGTLDVPLCAVCRTALKRGEEPDILDVVRDGEPVHYFDSGVEPWASTGFGALETDLVRALHGERR